jgi:hypothetical protein
MELQVIDGDLETAATRLFQKDERGWYITSAKGARSDATLTKQKTLQVLSGVTVQGCYDRNGKYRGLCEVSRYVYSNGHRNLLIVAGPYLGETEFGVLNSVRIPPAASVAHSPKRKK